MRKKIKLLNIYKKGIICFQKVMVRITANIAIEKVNIEPELEPEPEPEPKS
jgi:hypothetical protein